jgi:hypothetical protein
MNGKLLVKAASEPKAVLHISLQAAREALLWKLEGLSEYDVRRPMTPTGTNLLGLVKHVASVEAGYFGFVFNRPFGVRELIDDAAGLRADNDNMAPGDREWWHDYRSRLERVARNAEASTQK